MAKLYVVLLLLLLIPAVYGDGCVFRPPPDMGQPWLLGDEEQQFAAIKYDKGIQELLIGIDTGDSYNEAVWLFPIPGNPENIDIDILKGFPQFMGEDIEVGLKEILIAPYASFAASQLWPIPFTLLSRIGGFSKMADFASIQGGAEVHQSVTRRGLTLELVTAKNIVEFEEYLASKDLILPTELSPVLKSEYLGEDYSFVVGFITDIKEFNEDNVVARGYRRDGYNQFKVGAYVKFPTEKMFFPLKPTSVYGNKKVPAAIYVIGYVSPELFPGLEEEVTYRKGRVTFDLELERFFSDEEYTLNDHIREYYFDENYKRMETRDVTVGFASSVEYTRILINGKSNAYVNDLYIEDKVPAKISYFNFLRRNTGLIAIIIFAISSCLASFIAGSIYYKSQKKSLLFYLGLFNFATLFGYGFASSSFIKSRKNELPYNIKDKETYFSPWKMYWTAFTLFFLAGLFVIVTSMNWDLEGFAALIGTIAVIGIIVMAVKLTREYPKYKFDFTVRNIYKYIIIAVSFPIYIILLSAFFYFDLPLILGVISTAFAFTILTLIVYEKYFKKNVWVNIYYKENVNASFLISFSLMFLAISAVFYSILILAI